MAAQLADCVVVGAGVVGLATARALAARGREVFVLEAAERIGSVTSARNSEVVHAGIHYPRGSLKATCCVRGRDQLYQYCHERGVPFQRCGKLIVATSKEQLPILDRIKATAAGNGVSDIRHLDRSEVRAMEPEVQCEGALFSPSTGIVDSHSFMLALQGDLENDGGVVAFNAPVVEGDALPAAAGEPLIHLRVGGPSPLTLACRTVVNTAGLAAPRFARSLAGFPQELVPTPHFAKGNYYALSGRSPFKIPIYPVPEPNHAGLGVHATVDLQGRCRFGPDVEWVDTDSNYDVNPARADSLYKEVRKYWPGLPDGALTPDYSGIRPKVGGPGEPAADFVVQGPREHGVPGLVNLFGIESPGLTSSMALAEQVLLALGVAPSA